jgi:hypothetical protein
MHPVPAIILSAKLQECAQRVMGGIGGAGVETW